MKKLAFLSLLIFLIHTSYGQTNCATALPLTPGTQQCGDSNGNPGDFPADGSSPVNPCSVNHNDDEYWFTYTPGPDVDGVELTLSSLSAFFTGIFVFDDCPANTPNCVAFDINPASTADITISFLVDNSTTYKIAVATYGPPNGSLFCLDAMEVQCYPPNASLLSSPYDYTDCPVSLDYSFELDELAGSDFVTITAEDGAGNPAGTGGVATTSGIFTITDIPVPQTDWIIKIAHENDPSCDIELGPFAFKCPPINDDLCDAIELVVNASFVTGYNELASSENMEPDGSCWWYTGNLNSVWYSFVAPTTESVTVSTDHGNTPLSNTQLTVFSLSDCSDMTSLVELECDQDGGSGSYSKVDVFELTAGEMYVIQVDGYQNNVGEFNISVKEVDPDHDDCENAKFLMNGGSGEASLLGEYFAGATPSTYGTAVCDNGSTASPNDLWYRVGFGSGTLTVTVDPGMNSDIVLSLYTGCFPQLFQSCSDMGNDGVSETLSYTSSTFEIVYFRVYEKSLSGEPFDIFANAPVLPINLASFEAEVQTDGNQILWSTLSESNSDYIEVQSSASGSSDWKTIGEVKAQGESTSRVEYDFFDNNPFEFTYYRLNAVDNDGTGEYSNIISVRRKDDIGEMKLTPNPIRNYLHVQLSVPDAYVGNYNILDLSGKLMKKGTIQMINGMNSWDLFVEDLEACLYLMTLQTMDGLQVEKFVKQ